MVYTILDNFFTFIIILEFFINFLCNRVPYYATCYIFRKMRTQWHFLYTKPSANEDSRQGLGGGLEYD